MNPDQMDIGEVIMLGRFIGSMLFAATVLVGGIVISMHKRRR